MSVEKKLEQMTLREKIGQLFTIGFPSPWPTEEFIQMVKEYKVGNVILFSHNVGSREELGKLNAYLIQLIEKETGETPFITIDEEGGVVSRLPKDTAVLPSAMAQARCRGRIEEGSRIVGEELKTLGINFNLAPVLDINVNRILWQNVPDMQLEDIQRQVFCVLESISQDMVIQIQTLILHCRCWKRAWKNWKRKS